MNNMRIKDLIDEDFINYKNPCMFISTCMCDWKCCKEAGIPIDVCQNHGTSSNPDIDMPISKIYERYINNPITKAVVIGGLEPILQYKEVLELVEYFRDHDCQDDIVIYTGYYPHEIYDKLYEFVKYKNIVFKFGRYKPDTPSIFDKVLGVELASNNQYGAKLNQGKYDIITGLQETGGYCPCMIIQNDNTKCCCLAFKKQKTGVCHCGLWSK